MSRCPEIEKESRKEHKNIQFHFCQNFDLEFRVSQS